MKTVSAPQPVGKQQWESLRAVLEEIQSERERIEAFTDELLQEWQQIHGDLQNCQTTLSEQRRALTDQEERLKGDRATFDSERGTARRASERLHELEVELRQTRRDCQDWDTQRLQVRQQLSDVQEGFSSLTEIVDLVQSTHAELHRAAASLQQRASRLCCVLDDLPDTMPLDSTEHDTTAAWPPHEQPTETEVEAEDAPRDATVDDQPEFIPAESFEEESELVDEETIEDAGHEETSAADPVVGSVLAELARFVKSEAGCCVVTTLRMDFHVA